MNVTLPELSVVAPLHNEEGNIRELFARICAALEPTGRSFEVLLVNDGSTDQTEAILDELSLQDARLRPVHLDGNFGEAAALCAGFETARGEILLTLDGDLQNDPADLPRLLRALEEGGYRAVSGWRQERQEAFTTRVLPSLVANRLIAGVTGVPSRDNGCGLKAYRADVVKGIYLPHGLHRFMPAVFGVRAHEFAQIEVSDRRRQSGKSHYGLSRLFAVIRDLLVIPFVTRDARRGEDTADAVAAAGTVAGLAAIPVARRQHRGAALLLGLGSALSLGYALSVRSNLRRWEQAQAEKTFRIKRVGPPVDEQKTPPEAA